MKMYLFFLRILELDVKDVSSRAARNRLWTLDGFFQTTKFSFFFLYTILVSDDGVRETSGQSVLEPRRRLGTQIFNYTHFLRTPVSLYLLIYYFSPIRVSRANVSAENTGEYVFAENRFVSGERCARPRTKSCKHGRANSNAFVCENSKRHASRDERRRGGRERRNVA